MVLRQEQRRRVTSSAAADRYEPLDLAADRKERTWPMTAARETNTTCSEERQREREEAMNQAPPSEAGY